MKIIIVDSGQRHTALEVNENDTIGEVREKYFQKIGSRVFNQFKFMEDVFERW